MFPIVTGYEVTGDPAKGVKEMSRDMIDKFIDAYVEQALTASEFGFDMGTIHFAYRGLFGARFLSPLTNHRTDEYGGSL